MDASRVSPLVELVAVMAILAILVAVVAPAVTETRDASIRAQAQTDSKQVSNLAADYCSDQNESENRTPLTFDVGAISSTAADSTSVQQVKSSRWPEQFITGSYAVEFNPVASGAKVALVTLNDEENVLLADQTAILKLTAIDFTVLGGDTPDSVNRTSTVTLSDTSTVEIHNFLWLFEKESSGVGLSDDLRSVVVYQLTGSEVNETGGTVNLTYKRIL